MAVAGKRRQDKHEAPESDIEERLVSIRRVSKVTKGGRTFGFSALVVVGNGSGKVGYGTGSGLEVMDAKSKAKKAAEKAMKTINVPLREGRTLHHDIEGRFGAGKVNLRSAPAGTGIIAGGPLRAVFECLGIQDVVAKSIGTSNPHNMVKACFDGFSKMASPKLIAEKRSMKVGDITGRRDSSKKKSDDKK